MAVSAGARPHYVTLWDAGTPVADADGTFTQTRTALSPAAVWACIAPASARDLERSVAGTVQSTATHLVTMPYHAGVTTNTVVVFGTRSFSVTGVASPGEANRETVCLCTEIVT